MSNLILGKFALENLYYSTFTCLDQEGETGVNEPYGFRVDQEKIVEKDIRRGRVVPEG